MRLAAVAAAAAVVFAAGAFAADGDDDDAEPRSLFYFTFEETWQFCLYWICLWFGGKAAEAVRFPSLVGEMFVGIVLGPNVANFVPFYPAIMMIGQVGLILEMVHIGLNANIDHLQALGTHGVIVALLGSALPFGMAWGVAYGIGLDWRGCFTVATALSPTATGITAKVLHSSGMVHTPTGQLIITATVLDDLIAIMLLGELQAMHHKREGAEYLWPVLSPVVGILVGGYLALYIFPDLIEYTILPRIPPNHRDQVLMILIGALTIGLTRAAHECRAFFLMGAFLAGLCFSTCHEVHHVWDHQIKRIQYALLRVFYGASIAFEVPAGYFGNAEMWRNGFAFSTCLIAKLIAGATNTSPFIGHKFDYRAMLRVGTALAVWGEITLLVGVTGTEEGIISKRTFASIVIAVLLSVIFGPIALFYRLKYDRESRRADNFRKEQDLASERDGLKVYPHFLFYTLDVSCQAKWGLLQKLMKTADENNLEVVDFRVHGGHHSGASDVLFEMYLKDTIILAPLSEVQRAATLEEIELRDAREAALMFERGSYDDVPPEDLSEAQAAVAARAAALLPDGTALDDSFSSVDTAEMAEMQSNWALHKAHIASPHEVKMRIKHLKVAFEKDVVHDPRVVEMDGVAIARWEPPLDELHPENDDEMAVRFAEHIMHRIQFDKAGLHGYAFDDEVHRVPFEPVTHEHLPPAMTDLSFADDEAGVAAELLRRRSMASAVRRRRSSAAGSISREPVRSASGGATAAHPLRQAANGHSTPVDNYMTVVGPGLLDDSVNVQVGGGHDDDNNDVVDNDYAESPTDGTPLKRVEVVNSSEL